LHNFHVQVKFTNGIITSIDLWCWRYRRVCNKQRKL